MKKSLIVRQDGYKECGAASLLSIVRYYGGNISINKLETLSTFKDNAIIPANLRVFLISFINSPFDYYACVY